MFEPIFQHSHFTPHTQNSSSEGEPVLAENLSCPWLQSSVGGNELCTTIHGKDLKTKTNNIHKKNHGQVTVPGSMPQTWPWRHQSLSRSNRQVSIFWKDSYNIFDFHICGWQWIWRAAGPKPEPVEVAKIHIHPGWDRSQCCWWWLADRLRVGIEMIRQMTVDLKYNDLLG